MYACALVTCFLSKTCYYIKRLEPPTSKEYLVALMLMRDDNFGRVRLEGISVDQIQEGQRVRVMRLDQYNNLIEHVVGTVSLTDKGFDLRDVVAFDRSNKMQPTHNISIHRDEKVELYLVPRKQ